jgi:hypothetical protein
MTTAEPVVAILDDEPEMRKALRRLLTSRGFRVEEYACGEDLLAAPRTPFSQHAGESKPRIQETITLCPTQKLIMRRCPSRMR